MPKDRRRLAEELLIEAKKREVEGLVTYGDFDPLTDTRILCREAQDEILDAWNYIGVFLNKKHPGLRKRTEGTRALILGLYISLRQLEKDEMEANRQTRR